MPLSPFVWVGTPSCTICGRGALVRVPLDMWQNDAIDEFTHKECITDVPPLTPEEEEMAPPDVCMGTET